MHSLDSVRRLVLLLSCLVAACSEVASSASADAGTVADAEPALAACGPEFIAVETDFPDAGRITLCQPLTSDGVAVDVSSCIPRQTEARGDARLTVSTGGDGSAFAVLGPTTLAVGLIGSGPPCTAANALCSYRTGPRVCRAVVTRAGRVGDTVEAEVREPCRLFNDEGVEALTVDRLSVRGVLRLRYELNQPSHSDSGVQRAVECGVP